MAAISGKIETGGYDQGNDPLQVQPYISIDFITSMKPYNFNNFLFFFQELVAAVPSQRNWKGMFIAILVILSVIAMVALAVHIVTPEDPGPRLKGRRIILRDVISGRHKPRYFNGTWLSGTNYDTCQDSDLS